MGRLIEHAKKEFEVLGWPGDCEIQRAVCNNMLELLRVFSDQGHSGTTAPYVIDHFNRLARFQPISPLTGEHSEWEEVDNGVYQNKRCSSVFKNGKDGQAYDIDGRVFRYPDGSHFTGEGSRTLVDFPYVPPIEPEVVDVDEGGEPLDKSITRESLNMQPVKRQHEEKE